MDRSKSVEYADDFESLSEDFQLTSSGSIISSSIHTFRDQSNLNVSPQQYGSKSQSAVKYEHSAKSYPSEVATSLSLAKSSEYSITTDTIKTDLHLNTKSINHLETDTDIIQTKIDYTQYSYSNVFESLSRTNKTDFEEYTDDFDHSKSDISFTASSEFSDTKFTDNSSVEVTDISLDSEEEKAQDEFLQNIIKKCKRTGLKKKEIIPSSSIDNSINKTVSNFCTKQIKRLKSKSEAEEKTVLKKENLHMERMKGLYGIREEQINRLKLENTFHNLQKAAELTFHVPRKCNHCKEVLAANACENFVTVKKALVMKKLIDEKIEKQNLQCNDSVWLMGEVLRDMPQLRTHPQLVMNELLKPLEEMKYTKRVNSGIHMDLDNPLDLENHNFGKPKNASLHK